MMRDTIKCVFDRSLELFNEILFWQIELEIIGYVKGTVKFCLCYKPKSFLITCLNHYVFTFAFE